MRLGKRIGKRELWGEQYPGGKGGLHQSGGHSSRIVGWGSLYWGETYWKISKEERERERGGGGNEETDVFFLYLLTRGGRMRGGKL